MKNQLLFAAPGWLWVTALIIAVFLALIAYSAKRRRAQLAEFANPELLESLLASHSPVRRIVKNGLVVLAFLFLGIAMARPQWGVIEEEIQRKGEDVVFLLDVSKSMLAKDVQPNRLERAKLAMRDFLHRHAGGRVGLVAFAGDAFLWCPLTLDYEAFEETLGDLSPEHLNVPGSDIASALFVAKGAFEKTEKRKVLIILSDGEDLEKLGVKAAAKMAEEGIVIYTVGVGTPNGSQIMIPGPAGELVPMLDGNGQAVNSALDEKTLTEIAESTGGNYRLLRTVAGGMADVGKALRQSEGKALPQVRKLGIDRYQWPLGVAIFLIVVESLLATRRRKQATLDTVK
jgi:Ca-activated chloride channel family protein